MNPCYNFKGKYIYMRFFPIFFFVMFRLLRLAAMCVRRVTVVANGWLFTENALA
jgi:hypothetical protein